jgi:hypothetical protein
VLPCVDLDYQPQVTLLGPGDEWCKVELASTSIYMKRIQRLPTIGYEYGLVQNTQVFMDAPSIHPRMSVCK